MKRRAVRAWESFWPSLLIWLPLLSILILTEARLPDIPPHTVESRYAFLERLDSPEITLAILVIVAEFLIIKSLLMAKTYERLPSREGISARMDNGTVAVIYDRRKKGETDYLALSLIAANVAFAILYIIAIVLFLNQDWMERYPVEIRAIQNIARVGLVAVLIWGGYQLLSVPDPEREPAVSRLGVIATVLLIVQVVAVYLVTHANLNGAADRAEWAIRKWFGVD
jgi:hypothetical protein